VAGRFELEGLLERYGVTFDEVELGDAHPFFQLGVELGPEDMAWLARNVDRVYDEFVGHVAGGRGMDREAVHEVARGRVWTGRDAAERGLVDVLGGYPAAIDQARELAGLAPDAAVELRRFPADRSFLELLMEEARGGSDAGGLGSGAPAVGAWATVGHVVRGAARVLAVLGRDDGAAPVRTEMRPLRIPGS
jgi:protease IV